MKKALVALVALLAVAVALFVVFKQTLGHHVPAAKLVPGETLLFVNVPDFERSKGRWPETGLAKILAEPEVQSFLQKARSADGLKLDDKMEEFKRLFPREAFFALTSIEGPTPQWVAGFAFRGRKKDAVALLSEPRAAYKRSQPTGRSDIVTLEGVPVETFTVGESVVAEAFKGDWYFVANNLDLMKSTLAAAAQPSGSATALASKDVYQKSLAKLPVDGDLIVFGQLTNLADRVISLMKASGQTLDPKQMAELQRMQAVAWGTKMEGAQFRDTIFLLAPGGTAEAPLPRNALALSAADTLLYYGLALPPKIEIPETASLLDGVFPIIPAIQNALAQQKLQVSDLTLAFGPEVGAVVDWSEKDAQPSAFFALDVRDATKARAFVDALTGASPGIPAWSRTEENGVTIFQSPDEEGISMFTPSLALTDKFLVLGFNPATISSGVARLKTGQASIANMPVYAQAVKEVTAPTSGFGYLDVKTFFERAYSTMRPVISMSLAMTPDAGQYVDAGKLPATETISRHLQPSVYSQSVTAEGTLIESTGTLTFNQVLFTVVGGGVAAALPMMDEMIKSGMDLDPAKLLQGAPGFGAPAPAPAAPQKEAEAP